MSMAWNDRYSTAVINPAMYSVPWSVMNNVQHCDNKPCVFLGPLRPVPANLRRCNQEANVFYGAPFS